MLGLHVSKFNRILVSLTNMYNGDLAMLYNQKDAIKIFASFSKVMVAHSGNVWGYHFCNTNKSNYYNSFSVYIRCMLSGVLHISLTRFRS